MKQEKIFLHAMAMRFFRTPLSRSDKFKYKEMIMFARYVLKEEGINEKEIVGGRYKND